MQTVNMTVRVGRGERLPGPDSRCQLALRLCWSEQDPLTVDLALTASPPHPALPSGDWAILRDFLRYGLDEPTGDGAVRVRPGPDPQLVVVELPGHDTTRLLLVASARALRAFIECTQAIVPSGDVSEASLDALINRLLDA
jgi:Streptomyces sporulation and cell division protein, SsgA